MKTVKNYISFIVLVLVGVTLLPELLCAQIPSKIPDALTVIHSRKSVRKYLNKPVSKEQLEILLKAGRLPQRLEISDHGPL